MLGLLVLISNLMFAAIEFGEKISVCEENNGVFKGNSFKGYKCYNESGIYEVVELNEEWRMIK